MPSLSHRLRLRRAAVAAAIALVTAGVGIVLLKPARAQELVARELPLVTVYYFGPVAVPAGHTARMCGNNLFGDGSVRVRLMLLDAASGRVLATTEERRVSPRAQSCVDFAGREGPQELIGLMVPLDREDWGASSWNRARATFPVSSLQVLDAIGNLVVALQGPGRATVPRTQLPAVQ